MKEIGRARQGSVKVTNHDRKRRASACCCNNYLNFKHCFEYETLKKIVWSQLSDDFRQQQINGNMTHLV